MSSNEAILRQIYAEAVNEDSRSTSSRANSIEFHYTKKLAEQYINQGTSAVEIGCGTGYYAMHFANKCKEYIGIDLSEHHIEIFKNKIKSNNLKNIKAIVGDATRLYEMENDSFDVVMALGPMYHLPSGGAFFSQCRLSSSNRLHMTT